MVLFLIPNKYHFTGQPIFIFFVYFFDFLIRISLVLLIRISVVGLDIDEPNIDIL